MTFERLRRVDGASGLWLAVAVVLFGLLWVGAEKELGVSDPAAYARQAYWIASDSFAENSTYHPFSQRLGMIASIGLFYRLFGVNLFAAFLWPLCAAIVIICVVWSALSTPTAKIVSLVLCLGSWPLFHATLLLFPDLIAAAFMALAALFLSRRARTGANGVRDAARHPGPRQAAANASGGAAEALSRSHTAGGQRDPGDRVERGCNDGCPCLRPLSCS